MGHLIEREVLDPHALRSASDMLRHKTLLYIQGCLKRGRETEALRIRDLVRHWLD
jgi:serine/threonine-protein kinase RIO1